MGEPMEVQELGGQTAHSLPSTRPTNATQVTDDRPDGALPQWLEQRQRTIAVRAFLDSRSEPCDENGVSLYEIDKTLFTGLSR